MNQNFIDQQLDLVSEWGIAKRYSRYSDICQIIHIDDSIGNGYFASYDFDKISLLKLNGQFESTQHISNDQANATATALHSIYFLLEGHYGFYHTKSAEDNTANTSENTHAYELIAPSFWLFSGNSDIALTAHVPKNTPIKAFQLHLSDTFVNLLINQLQNIPFSEQGLLQHFLIQARATNSPSELKVPFTTAIQTIYQQAWQLFNTSHPTDEVSLVRLQGATFTFFSELLKLPLLNALENSCNVPSYALHAKLLLDQFYTQNWTTRELAKKVHTNESYLKKHFKALTGMPLSTYRTKLRMEKASELLATGVSSPEVAHRLGFASHHYFKKAFSTYTKNKNH